MSKASSDVPSEFRQLDVQEGRCNVFVPTSGGTHAANLSWRQNAACTGLGFAEQMGNCFAGTTPAPDATAGVGRNAGCEFAAGLVQVCMRNCLGIPWCYEDRRAFARSDLVLPTEALLDGDVCFLCIQKPKARRRGKGKTQHSKITDAATVKFATALFEDMNVNSLLYPSSASTGGGGIGFCRRLRFLRLLN